MKGEEIVSIKSFASLQIQVIAIISLQWDEWLRENELDSIMRKCVLASTWLVAWI